MKDFTIKIYKQLLETLINSSYEFQTVRDFIAHPKSKTIMLRHDVDGRKFHSLEFAKIQAEKGIKGTYYFRMVPQSFDPCVIKEIQAMGHEIGYHYEDMDFANGNTEKAIQLFEKHLMELRKIADIQTICMHGSPKSKYDNKDIWKKYNYKDYNLVAEPYFDLNFEKIFYLTDTGMRWDGHKVSVRDKVKTSTRFPSIHHTKEIIERAQNLTLPSQIMINFHPERWTDNSILWWKNRTLQNIKNPIKRALIFIQNQNKS